MQDILLGLMEPVVIVWIIFFFVTLLLTYAQHKVQTAVWKTGPLGLMLFCIMSTLCAAYTFLFILIFYNEVLMSHPIIHFITNWFWLLPTVLAIYFGRKAVKTPPRRP